MPGMRPGLLVLLAATLVACGSAAPSSTPRSMTSEPAVTASVAATPAIDAARVAAELDALLGSLETTHPDPFHAVDRAAFVRELEGYAEQVELLAPDEAAVELMRIWATIEPDVPVAVRADDHFDGRDPTLAAAQRALGADAADGG